MLSCTLLSGKASSHRPRLQASYCGSVKVLLSSGCDPFVRNADGSTAFDLVEEKGRLAYDNFLQLVST